MEEKFSGGWNIYILYVYDEQKNEEQFDCVSAIRKVEGGEIFKGNWLRE